MASVVFSSSCCCSAPRTTNVPGASSHTLETGLLRGCSKRGFILKSTALIPYFAVNLSLPFHLPPAFAAVEPAPDGEISTEQPLPPPQPRKPVLGGIANTSSWFQYIGDGFAIRVPPLFEDVMEPEDYNAGLSLYGDKVKPRTFAARFASPDGSEVLSVVIRPSNQLKITFLEAKDITDLGSLKVAARIFVPGGATLYSARTIKIKEDDNLRNYYYYEFGLDDQHVALMTGINTGKAFIAGASAPQSKWDADGVKLRSAAISLAVS